ncbi:MAG: histidine phosphatase family protein [Gammaproteobacteria bacterium]|nr:histidine phosphatase family protein [Gammaproteobacteria bacterium]
MTRELLILRHAKSAWDTPAKRDFDRPLNGRGKRDAPRVGAWLGDRGLVPDHIVASPARRARQTVRRACEAMGIDTGRVDWQERIYLAEIPTLLRVLEACPPTANRVLLVGHNPGLEELLTYLGGVQLPLPDGGKRLPTATLARLALPDDWSSLKAGHGELLDWVRPRDLPEV